MIPTLLISLGGTSYSQLQSSRNTSPVKFENGCSYQTSYRVSGVLFLSLYREPYGLQLPTTQQAAI